MAIGWGTTAMNGEEQGIQAASFPATPMASRTAFLDFFDHEYHSVIRFVMLNGAALDDAQDAVQDAFLQAWEMWEHIHNPVAWIRVVALRYYRRPPGQRRRMTTLPVASVPDIPQSGLSPSELSNQTLDVLAALRGLDEQSRTVMAFHLDGFPTSAIAEVLGLTDQRVRDLKKKARGSLARILAQTGDNEGRASR